MTQNKTDYARSIGYSGKKEVLVQDGKVSSHSYIDWMVFCKKCRQNQIKN